MNERQKKYFEIAEKSAEDRGGVCLSDEYVNNGTGPNGAKMLWKCAKNHEWRATYSNVVVSKHWCPICGRKKGMSEEFKASQLKKAQAHAKKMGGECLSEEYVNNGTGPNGAKMLWKCKEGHEWTACFIAVVGKRKTWCPICDLIATGHKASQLEKAQAHAKKMGGECLSEKYTRSHDKMLWKCKEGHEWYATYHCVVDSNKRWCPICGSVESGRKQKTATLKAARKSAKKKGGRCLAKEKDIKNNKSKLLWECEKKHQWNATYNGVVHSGKWCPRCASKTQERLREILERLFKQKSKIIHPNWLENPHTGYNLEIDIYFEQLGLAVEYNGEQHYKKVNWSGAMTDAEMTENLKSTKERDELKKQLIEQNPDKIKHFIIFTYKEKITEKSVIKKLTKHGIMIGKKNDVCTLTLP